MAKTREFFRRFLAFIWFGEVTRPSFENIVIDEVTVDSSDQEKIIEQQNDPAIRKYSSKEQVRNELITTITRVVIVICSVSFCVIVFYSLFYPDRSVPDIIQTSFWTTLGWFGGALGAFFQFDQSI